MARIERITDAYVRRYSDSGEMSAFIEWVDERGHTGCTEGHLICFSCGRKGLGAHMTALFQRAKREGITVRNETW